MKKSFLPYHPFVIMMVDMRGKLKLHGPSWGAVRKHFDKQFAAATKLRKILKARGK